MLAHATTGPFASIFTEIVLVGPFFPTESRAENDSVVVPSAVMVTTFELPGLVVLAIGWAPDAEYVICVTPEPPPSFAVIVTSTAPALKPSASAAGSATAETVGPTVSIGTVVSKVFPMSSLTMSLWMPSRVELAVAGTGIFPSAGTGANASPSRL